MSASTSYKYVVFAPKAASSAYSVVLQDMTTNETVGTRQISLQPGSGAATWTLVPYNGTTSGPDIADTFAFAGYADQSVSSVDFSVAGLTAGDNVKLTISNPNGVVQIALVMKTATATTDFGKIAFPIETSTEIAGYGPFFPSNDIFGPSARRRRTTRVRIRRRPHTHGAKRATRRCRPRRPDCSFRRSTAPRPSAGRHGDERSGDDRLVDHLIDQQRPSEVYAHRAIAEYARRLP